LPIGSAADGHDQRIAAGKSSQSASGSGSIGKRAGLHFPSAGFASDAHLPESDSLDFNPDAGRLSFGVASLGEAAELDGVSRRAESDPGLVRVGAGDGRCSVKTPACQRLPSGRLEILGRQQECPSRFFPAEF
jgi:hypothetical protein